MHDHATEVSLSDVTKLKENKYNWIMQYNENYTSDIIEQFKDQ